MENLMFSQFWHQIFTKIYGWFLKKIQRGDPMKTWKSKLSLMFDTHCGKLLGYPECTCKVSKKFINGKVKIRRTRTIWRRDEQTLLDFWKPLLLTAGLCSTPLEVVFWFEEWWFYLINCHFVEKYPTFKSKFLENFIYNQWL